MKIHKLKDMVKGWFVGNFEPSLYKTHLVEVGVKEYKAGDKEVGHAHIGFRERECFTPFGLHWYRYLQCDERIDRAGRFPLHR